jgi:DNA polymerase-1
VTVKASPGMKARPGTRRAYSLFHEGLLALGEMEHNGIKIDVKYLKRTIEQTNRKIKRLENELKTSKVWKIWKKKVNNPNMWSPKQLGFVFFTLLKYKAKLHTEKTGEASTKEEAFEDIDHPFVKKYFRIKKLKHIVSTYLLGTLREVCDEYLHPSYSLAGGSADDEGKGGALSFRSSCSSPNFQNYPIRIEEMAALIRPAFRARDDKNYQLVDTDFSQLEVRIAYSYTKDPVLKRYIEDPTTDMHRDAASMLFLCDGKYVSKPIRHVGKNRFVFPQFYGSYYTDCAKSIWGEINRQNFKLEGKNITVVKWLKKKGIRGLGKLEGDPKPGTFEYQVRKVEDHFWNKQFKTYTEWKKKWWNLYLKRGWFPLKTGFICSGEYRRNQVLNFAIQGSAFHCLLWCIVKINKELKRRNMKSRIVGQIHDSILGDVHRKELQKYLHICNRVMTKDLPKHFKWITIKMEMEPDVAPVGGSWHQKKPWELKDGKWREKPKKV